MSNIDNIKNWLDTHLAESIDNDNGLSQAKYLEWWQ